LTIEPLMDVQQTFKDIALRYDRMNRAMTLGQDRHWRRELVKGLALQPGERLLDLGAGTGDLSFEAIRQQPGCHVVAADFTLAMLRLGQQRAGGDLLPWTTADALCLPFPDESFDAVISGFLLRNVHDLDQALREQKRVLKPNGRLASLDTSRPARNWLSPFIKIYLNFYIPLLGRVIAGNRNAYQYLSASTQAFLTAEELAERMSQAGFRAVRFQRRMAGTIGLHWANKP
jgi:demethylmenaquinone methyltransferase/2-methoxy-6-polyprenyl-1,4-benzoquinol methylase